MSDLGKYFPLSQKPRVDESHVTGNWCRALGEVVLQLADVLDEIGPARLADPSLRPGWTIGGLGDQLAWRLGNPKRTRWAELARLAAGAGERRDHEVGPTAEDAAVRLRRIALAAMTASTRRGVADLAEAVVALADVAVSVGSSVRVDPVASGAVALARTLSAPIEIRAVVRGRTLVAVDAGWRIGRGPEIVGSAFDIVLFLFGRSGIPGSAAR